MATRVFISQPMNGKTDEEIIETRDRAIEYLLNAGYEVVSGYDYCKPFKKKHFDDLGINDDGVPILYLGFSITAIAKCQAIYFCEGWEKARGCLIEHGVAKAYGLEIMYEELDCYD